MVLEFYFDILQDLKVLDKDYRCEKSSKLFKSSNMFNSNTNFFSKFTLLTLHFEIFGN